MFVPLSPTWDIKISRTRRVYVSGFIRSIELGFQLSIRGAGVKKIITCAFFRDDAQVDRGFSGGVGGGHVSFSLVRAKYHRTPSAPVGGGAGHTEWIPGFLDT